MADAINNDYLQKILLPRNYKLDSSREQITFWKRVSNKDTRTKFAFTMITVTKHVHSLRLEGINELRLQNEIKAGKIVLEDEDDFFNYFETVFETTLDSTDRFDKILDFFELQLHILEDMPNYSEEYKKALDNVDCARPLRLYVKIANREKIK